MMSPGFMVVMSSFCGPAIFSASLTARCTSCSDMSCVRACCEVGAGGGAAAGGGGGADGCDASARARAGGGGAGMGDTLDACVALSGRCPEGECETGERFCVEERRVPLCEKRESRSDNARSAACATVCSAAEVC